MRGTVSVFGGAADATMAKDTGLSFYEPHEADACKRLFYDEDPGWLAAHPEWAAANPGQRQPTWARLRPDALYHAYRVPAGFSREDAHTKPWPISNPRTGVTIFSWLVDRGPGILTRLVDLSPGALAALGVQDIVGEVEVEVP